MTKQCSKCGKDQPLDFFLRRSDRPNSLQSHCRACRTAASVARYVSVKKPPEYFEARRAEKAAIRAEEKKKKAEIRAAALEIQKAATRERQKIADKLAKKEARRKHRSRRVEKTNTKHRDKGRLSWGIEKVLMEKQGGLCVYCQADISVDRHIDHIFPLCLGGKNVDENVQLTCPSCNMKKGRLAPDIFASLLKA